MTALSDLLGSIRRIDRETQSRMEPVCPLADPLAGAVQSVHSHTPPPGSQTPTPNAPHESHPGLLRRCHDGVDRIPRVTPCCPPFPRLLLIPGHQSSPRKLVSNRTRSVIPSTRCGPIRRKLQFLTRRETTRRRV